MSAEDIADYMIFRVAADTAEKTIGLPLPG
jgi:hypothetical protein